MRRRELLAAGVAGAAGVPGAACAAMPPPDAAAPRVLRYAFPAAETGFDPARIQDLYSRTVTAHIFDGLYKYDHLARPVKVKPNTAVAMPEVADDFRRWTIRLQPGIFFADDPAFGGRPRELVAQDYVYAFKRFFDPATNGPLYSTFDEHGVEGLRELREAALKSGRPFDYDREVPGLRAIDRYTLQFQLDKPRPRFLYALADASIFGAVAREVVERYGDQIMAHPVGTGPFRLVQWRRSSLIVLERNPGFRELHYDAEPAPDDATGRALLARFKGRRLPMLDRVEISVIDESQPRWLSFLGGEFDLSYGVPLEFSAQAVPNGALAPNLARRGVALHRIASPDRTLVYFNMDDPIVGGMDAPRVALRRAIGLATDVGREIELIRRGQAIVAQTVVAPGTWGYDPALRTENGEYSVARANALLDIHGYADRDGDGWRETPDGRPLVIECPTQPSAIDRQYEELWKRNLEAIHLRMQTRSAQWPEQLKAARAGRLMLWQLGYTASSPDAQDGLQLLYGPASGGQNLGRFRHPGFDAIYERMQVLPDGPERLALLREAQKLIVAFMPHKYSVHRIVNDLAHPWLVGFRRPLFGNQFWQYVDIDLAQRNG